MQEQLLEDMVYGRRLWLGFLVLIAGIVIGGILLILWTCNVF
jgi:hypothetical protein